jgi:hypothetical protein
VAVVRSQGTHDTQGINGRAIGLQRVLAAVDLRLCSDDPCPYDVHRATDWRLRAGGPVVCGVCHPPAAGLDVELVAA